MILIQQKNDTRSVDYSDANNWLNLPELAGKPIDVFYVYPSAWSKSDAEEFNICPVSHNGMRKGAEIVFPVQASVFFPIANVFAPYYRQIDPLTALPLCFDKRKELIRQIPYHDVKDAFMYYIEHFNNGRPFILSAHSQGTEILRELVFDYMAVNRDVYQRMVAAYLIGYGVTETELAAHPHAKFAEFADDTGVIISYNTEAPGSTIQNPTVPPKTLLINPISWRRDDTYASADHNLGSLITGHGKLEVKRNFADAKINPTRRTLICGSIDPAEYGGPPMLGTFHMLDYALYYLNLRQNAALRIRRFFEKNS